MKIEVLSAQWTCKEHSQFLAKLRLENQSDPVGFYVATEVPDESEIYKYLIELYRSGKLKIKEFVENVDLLKSDIRAQRNALLSETDYLVNNDYPISESDKKLIREYRQTLRDIPQQRGFPKNVTWPEKPKCIK